MMPFLTSSQTVYRRLFLCHLPHRMATLAALTAILALAQTLCLQPVAAESKGIPNIVFIMADDK